VFCSRPLMTENLNNMIEDHRKGTLIGHINCDSTAIPARETPVNKDADEKPQKVEHKKGHPRKDEVRPPKEPTTLELQAVQSARNSLSKLQKNFA